MNVRSWPWHVVVELSPRWPRSAAERNQSAGGKKPRRHDKRRASPQWTSLRGHRSAISYHRAILRRFFNAEDAKVVAEKRGGGFSLRSSAQTSASFALKHPRENGGTARTAVGEAQSSSAMLLLWSLVACEPLAAAHEYSFRRRDAAAGRADLATLRPQITIAGIFVVVPESRVKLAL